MSDARNDELKSWLRRLVGNRVTDINFSVYVAANGALPPEPLQIEIIRDAAERGMIVLSPEGERVEHSNDELLIGDVGEYGHVERWKSVPGFDRRGIVGATIENVELILYAGVAFGVGFEFSTGARLIVVNNGDQMLILTDRDHPALQEDGMGYERIC